MQKTLSHTMFAHDMAQDDETLDDYSSRATFQSQKKNNHSETQAHAKRPDKRGVPVWHSHLFCLCRRLVG